jgi:hypothetical protein
MPLDGQVSDYLAPDTETNPDVFSLEGFIQWAETKPAEGRYEWAVTSDCRGGCLIHQYLRDNGKHPCWDYKRMSCLGATPGGHSFDVDVAMEYPRTYGAALDRARALLASRNR